MIELGTICSGLSRGDSVREHVETSIRSFLCSICITSWTIAIEGRRQSSCFWRLRHRPLSHEITVRNNPKKSDNSKKGCIRNFARFGGSSSGVENWRQKKIAATAGGRTQAVLLPLDSSELRTFLKSNALTTRPPTLISKLR
jgi:hypothetical protein